MHSDFSANKHHAEPLFFLMWLQFLCKKSGYEFFALFSDNDYCLHYLFQKYVSRQTELLQLFTHKLKLFTHRNYCCYLPTN